MFIVQCDKKKTHLVDGLIGDKFWVMFGVPLHLQSYVPCVFNAIIDRGGGHCQGNLDLNNVITVGNPYGWPS